MKCNSRDVFTLAEAVATNVQSQCPYEPRQGCLTAARRLVKLGYLIESPHGDGRFLPTERGFKVDQFLSKMLPLVP